MMNIDKLIYQSISLLRGKADDDPFHAWAREIMQEGLRMRKSMVVQWKPRGIGSNWNIPDLVTGIDDGKLAPDMSGFVRSKAEGLLAVIIFNNHAYLDFRPSEPDWIQVKVSAKIEVLTELQKLVIENNFLLTPEIVEQAKYEDECYDPLGLKPKKKEETAL